MIGGTGIPGGAAPDFPATALGRPTARTEVLALLRRPPSEYRGGPFKWFPTASQALAAVVGEWLAAGQRPGA